jgi:hypothetical protein
MMGQAEARPGLVPRLRSIPHDASDAMITGSGSGQVGTVQRSLRGGRGDAMMMARSGPEVIRSGSYQRPRRRTRDAAMMMANRPGGSGPGPGLYQRTAMLPAMAMMMQYIRSGQGLENCARLRC